jgi:hypothetical protein
MRENQQAGWQALVPLTVLSRPPRSTKTALVVPPDRKHRACPTCREASSRRVRRKLGGAFRLAFRPTRNTRLRSAVAAVAEAHEEEVAVRAYERNPE